MQAGDVYGVDIPKECRICYDLPVRTAFAGCGHMVCCTRCALEFAQECAEFVWQGQPSAAHAATVRALKEFVTNMLTVSSTREAEFQHFRWFCLGRKGP